MFLILGSVAALCVVGSIVMFALPSDEKSEPKTGSGDLDLRTADESAKAFHDSVEGGSVMERPEPVIKIPEPPSVYPKPASVYPKGGDLYAMTPVEILFFFDGRIGRGQWWIYSFIVQVLSTLFSMLIAYLGMPMLIIVAIVFSFWTSLALCIKRWHDRDKSGFWMFIGAIPLIGGIWSVIELGFLEGTQGDNSYGKAPVG